MSDYSDEQIKRIKCDLLNDHIKRLEDTKKKLEYDCSVLKPQVDSHRQRLYVHQELKSMGLGLKELRLSRDTINEIAAEKGIIYKDAIREFFESLKRQYDIKFRLKWSPTITNTIAISSYSTGEDQFNSTTNTNYSSFKQYYTGQPKQDIQHQQVQQQKTRLSVYNYNNSNTISTNGNKLIKDKTSNLDFTDLQIKPNDNINNHTLDILTKTGCLVPSSEKNKQPVKAK